MTELNITIRKAGEESQQPEFADATALNLVGADIIGQATEQERTGVILFLVDEAGNKYRAATTARIVVNGLAPVIQGAMQRFGDV